MNRIAAKPQFMTNDAIAEAARIFEEERERKEKAKQDALNANNMNQDANSGKLKPILIITKGKLGMKTKKRDLDDEANRDKKGLQARDIKGMEEIHWKVVQTRRELEETKTLIEKNQLTIFDLLYEPFELYTVKRKRTQIELLKECVFELKRDFNKEFEDLKNKKSLKKDDIGEKNEIIRDLLENLNEPDEIVEIEPDEDPKAILHVAESEVKIEKYLTKEQRAAEEERLRIEAEKEAKLRGDNLQMRGLKTMLGGTELIMKKEKNKLQEELVREDWMNTKKEEDMTEDEKQRFAEQIQKEKDLIEKQRKQWKINLKRVEADIVEMQAKFEESLLELYKKRLFYDSRIYEQELYIVRLIIMLHDVGETKENRGKFEEELVKVQQELDEKREFVHICLD